MEVAFRPGVTDVAARELRRGMQEIGLPDCEVATGTRFELAGAVDRGGAAPPGAPAPLQRDGAALQPRPARPPFRAGGRRRRTGGDRAHRRAGRRAVAGAEQAPPALARPGRDAHDPTLLRRGGPRPHRRRAGDAGADLVRALRPQDLQGADRLHLAERRRQRAPAGIHRRPASPVSARRDGCRVARLAAFRLRGQRRHHRLRRRVRPGLQGGDAQPPVGAGTLRRRQHGRGRRGARHHRRVGAAHRHHRRALLRPAGLPPTMRCPPASCTRSASPRASWPASATTATSWGCPRSTARFSTTTATWATRWSSAAAPGCCPTAAIPRRRSRATWWWRSAGAPAATASTAPPSPPPS